MRDRALTQAMLGNIKDLPSLLNFTAAEESARQPTPQVSALQRGKTPNKEGSKYKCGHCGYQQHGPFNKERINQCKAYGSQCTRCKKLHHNASVCKTKRDQNKDISQTAAITEDVDNTEIAGFLAALVSDAEILNPKQASPVLQEIRSNVKHTVNSLPLPHHKYDKMARQWKKTPPNPSPTLTVSVQVDRSAYKELQLSPPQFVKRNSAGHARERKATADTGAQLTVINVKELMALGVKKESIFRLATSVSTVTRASVDLVGGIFLVISSHDPSSGAVRRTRQLAYVSSTVPGIYLSNEACIDLGCVPKEFPAVGQCNALQTEIKPRKCSNSGMGNQSDVCDCPRRTTPPTDMPTLPCDPTEQNLPILRDYILQRFASSAFNCCERQPLPMMENSPPLRLFVDPVASPYAVTSPAKIPLHWDQQVKAGLDRDVSLGVIEKVPVNEPVKWCSRMLVTPKHDGSPRRVIDYSQLNKHAPRQTHHTKSPYQIAVSIPGGKVKTVLDNWHGYHSVPIMPEDRPLTTFLTPYGRYRYRTTPQGLISAGDGYTQRMDIITAGTKDYEHCVDDTILWDDTVEQNFFRVCQFITTCAMAGCIFNPSKFQFASTSVDFLGFRITSEGVTPHPAFLETILSFPTPKSLTDIRSWFGLVNQVSYTFASAPVMEPFRKLLSSKIPFYWSEELSHSFELSKNEVVRQCEKGVRSFQLNAPTVLATDWSKAAVGCWLTQKQCKCPSTLPNCCQGGWQTVFATSKFNTPTVAGYHPIEGEAFAAAWALERCRIFTLGHPNLTLAVDHRPLIAILGTDYDLGELLNPRLMNFKLKSMAYRFTPVHIPGKRHVVPDTMSRRTDAPVLAAPKPPRVAPMDSAVTAEYCDSFGPPSWVSPPQIAGMEELHSSRYLPDQDELYVAQVQETLGQLAGTNFKDDTAVITWNMLENACNADPDYTELKKTLSDGFPKDIQDCAVAVKPYCKMQQEFTSLGDIVMLHN